jgi:flagellar hook-associated protein 3 FlgL
MDILARMNLEASMLRSRMEVLSRQVPSGARGETLGDIAPDVPRALNLSSDIGRRETYMRSIDQASGRMEVMQSSLQRMKNIASEFRSEVAVRLSSRDENSLVTVKARARAAIMEVGALLNTRHNGEFLFGGSDLAKPPVKDPATLASGPMAVQIADAIALLDDSNHAAVLDLTRTAAQATDPGTSPFSDFLEDPARGAGEPRRSVPVGDAQRLDYGISANRNAMATSEGETTGSWARDLLRSLMTLSALEPAQLGFRDSFEELASGIRQSLESSENALAEEMGALGAVQRQADTARSRHSDLTDALSKQLSSVIEVDMEETLTRLQGTRNALEASYRVTASLANLTLAQFLR